MPFRPLHDNVLAGRIETAARTTGGILIPDIAQQKPQEESDILVGVG